MSKVVRSWSQKRDKKLEKLKMVGKWLNGKYVDASRIVDILEALIEPGAGSSWRGTTRSRRLFCPRSCWKSIPARCMICI